MLEPSTKGAGNRACYRLLPALARVLIGQKLGHFESIEQAYLSVMEPPCCCFFFRGHGQCQGKLCPTDFNIQTVCRRFCQAIQGNEGSRGRYCNKIFFLVKRQHRNSKEIIKRNHDFVTRMPKKKNTKSVSLAPESSSLDDQITKLTIRAFALCRHFPIRLRRRRLERQPFALTKS